MPSGKKRKRHKMATHKRKKRLRKNRHKKKNKSYVKFIKVAKYLFKGVLYTYKPYIPFFHGQLVAAVSDQFTPSIFPKSPIQPLNRSITV